MSFNYDSLAVITPSRLFISKLSKRVAAKSRCHEGGKGAMSGIVHGGFTEPAKQKMPLLATVAVSIVG